MPNSVAAVNSMLIPTNDTKAIKAAIKSRKCHIRVDGTDLWVRVNHADVMRVAAQMEDYSRRRGEFAALNIYIRCDGNAMGEADCTDRQNNGTAQHPP